MNFHRIFSGKKPDKPATPFRHFAWFYKSTIESRAFQPRCMTWALASLSLPMKNIPTTGHRGLHDLFTLIFTRKKRQDLFGHYGNYDVKIKFSGKTRCQRKNFRSEERNNLGVGWFFGRIVDYSRRIRYDLLWLRYISVRSFHTRRRNDHNPRYLLVPTQRISSWSATRGR